MNKKNAVKLINISKFYKLYRSSKDRLKEALFPFRGKLHHEFYALRNINFNVNKSEVYGILGKNGSGKSTLLKIISGVLQPNSGNIIVNGKVSALFEIGGGFNPEFTGIQNIYFLGTLLGFNKKVMEGKTDEIITFADIGDYIYQPVKMYSSGMKARLGFAVAITIDPEILIIDEVLAVGDELFRRMCYSKIRSFMDKGKTILFVTHNTSIINELCTKAALLDNGELILTGSPKLVTTEYRRLLFSIKSSYKNIRSDIIKINTNERLKNSMQSSKVIGKVQPIKFLNKKNEKYPSEKEYFISGFKPKSTTSIKNYKIDIFDLKIMTLDKKKINHLLINREYIYSYKVKFDIDIDNINFGMGIKNKKGIYDGRYILE